MTPGKAFEARVIKMLEELLNDGDFGFEFAQIKPHPKYFSKDREDFITFDASIEVFRRDATEPSIVWIWECKWSDSRSIEGGEIEQFNSQLQQVGSSKFKGTVISNSGYQKAALRYAKSHGIGLIRLLNDGQLHTIMETFDIRNRVVRSLLAQNPIDAESIFAAITTTTEFATNLYDLIELELYDF